MIAEDTKIITFGGIIMYKKAITVISLLLVTLLLFSACESAEKLTEYAFGPDKVASINAVLGENRKVSGVSTGTKNGVQYKEYTYETSSMVDDLAAYSSHLQNNGWLVVKDYNFADGKGEAQLAIESADNDKILVVSIVFDTSRYTIRVDKLKGSLTPN